MASSMQVEGHHGHDRPEGLLAEDRARRGARRPRTVGATKAPSRVPPATKVAPARTASSTRSTTSAARRSLMSGPTSLSSRSWSATTSCGRPASARLAREVRDHAPIHQHALDRAADLAVASRQAAQEDGPRGQLQVRVGTDDGGVVAAQLGVERLQVLGRDAAQVDARLDAAGERDHAARRGSPPAAARCGRPAGQHLVRRGGRPHSSRIAARRSSVSGQSLGGLPMTALPAPRPRADLVGVQLHRIVEGHDGGHHADGLPDDHGHVALRAGHGVHGHLPAEDPLGLLAEAADDARRGIDLVARLADGLAVLLGQQRAMSSRSAIEAIGAGDEDARTARGRASGPWPAGRPGRRPRRARTSSSLARGTWSMTAPVPGLRTAMVAPSEASHQAPAMSIRIWVLLVPDRGMLMYLESCSMVLRPSSARGPSTRMADCLASSRPMLQPDYRNAPRR